MILSFKPQFVQPILNGSKIHSIRLDPHCRWKSGMKIHMATGVRTKNYNCFLVEKCKGVQDVEMRIVYRTIAVRIDGYHLAPSQLIRFANRDGFESYKDFHNWFMPLIEASPDGVYKAKIIHWTNLRY